MSIRNTAFLTVLDRVKNDRIANIECQKGAVILNEDTGDVLFCDGTQWIVLSSGTTNKQGFIDYNDTTGPLSLIANEWTDVPNNGQGAFSNDTYKPSGVTELLDVATGYIDPTNLELGDTLLIRNDYTINPSTNNSLLRLRYSLGDGAGAYTLEKIIGRLDSGSGQDYRFSLSPDLIYMGDENTRNNPIKIQVNCTSNATLTNAGSVIQVIKREL